MKRFLFFFVHPAKFHAFRATINELKRRGHCVDVLITSKEVLEELVRREGWAYTNLFPNGRRIPRVHTYLSAAVNTPRTIARLLHATRGRRYDLYITDDLLTWVGRLRRVPSIFFTDDDITAVPESALIAGPATHIVSPAACRMGRFSYKQLGYPGFKALAHLHPARFTPDRHRLDPLFQQQPYFFLRLVSATSTHDVGKAGIGDDHARQIIEVLRAHGRVLISAQRQLPEDLQPYQTEIDKAAVAHYLAHAEIVISDSTTMCAEAAVLGTPAVEIDDWFADFGQFNELSHRYELIQGFSPRHLPAAIGAIQTLLAVPDRRERFAERRRRLLAETVDVSGFLIWLFENYPKSAIELRSNPQAVRGRF